jgi:hypothetical protein
MRRIRISCGKADHDALQAHNKIRATRTSAEGSIGRPSTLPIGGIGAIDATLAASLVHGQADCAELQTNTLTSVLTIERHFRYRAHPRSDEQDQPVGSHKAEERWYASRVEDGGIRSVRALKSVDS